MLNVHLTDSATHLLRKALAAVAICAIALAFIGAGSAHADTKKGSGGSQGCLIENDGKLETVPVGSKVGLFTCGSDGEWHFGWLINAVAARPSKSVSSGVTAPLHHGALQAAKARTRR
jgi:hypothetical protein